MLFRSTRSDLGNFGRMFDRHGWNFVDDLGENYGSVVRLMGPMGVSSVFSSSFHRTRVDLFDDAQRRVLYVFDPKALQHVVVKDQYTYAQAGFTAGYVDPPTLCS